MGIEDFLNKLNKPMNRREFIKNAGGAVIASSGLANLSFQAKENNLENQEELNIVKREDWDTAWEGEEGEYDGIKGRYDKDKGIGDFYTFKILDKKRTREVTTFRYLESKEKVYNRMIIHHTEMDEVSLVGNDPIKQMEFLRDSQMVREFGDIAYNFAITSDGQIFECTPTTHFSYHAGHTKESDNYLKKNLPLGIKSIREEKDPKKKKQKIEHYINSKKMDPDYRSLGVVLLGNLNNNTPTEAQIRSFKKLMDVKKNEYHIPNKNIIGHNEVNEKVVKASGLTLATSDKKTCPGNNFPDLEALKQDLSEDSEQAKKKSILLKSVLK